MRKSAAAKVLHHRFARRLAVAGLLVAVLGVCTANEPSRFVLGSEPRSVSVAQLRQDIDALYLQHPTISSFESQSVQYTPQSLAVVLRKCTQAGTQSGAEAESSRLMACAPLIYFFYSYGQEKSVPEATRVADDLYSFAVSDVKGPVDARAALTKLLGSWGIPVAR